MGWCVLTFHMANLHTLHRIAVIAVFTAVETAALAIWLRFVRDEPTMSTAAAIGLGVLAVGLILEHILTDVAVNGFNLELPLVAIVILSVSETLLWAIWLEVADLVGGINGFVIAFVVLAILLVPQHTVEDNILQGRGLIDDVINLNTAGISLIEAAGATVWLALVLRPDLIGGMVLGFEAALVGFGILAVSLLVEHNIGVRFSSR